MRTARFWIRVNGSAVKLSMRDGDELSWLRQFETDEGYRNEYQKFLYEDAKIYSAMGEDGWDCDGGYSDCRHHSCDVVNLSSGALYEGVTYPIWDLDNHFVSDPQAEKAGY